MFEPGEAVECVDDTPRDGKPFIHLKKGKIYRIKDYLGRCPCSVHADDPDAVFVVLQELPINVWRARRFAPIRPPSDELTRRIKRCRPTQVPTKVDARLDDVLGRL